MGLLGGAFCRLRWAYSLVAQQLLMPGCSKRADRSGQRRCAPGKAAAMPPPHLMGGRLRCRWAAPPLPPLLAQLVAAADWTMPAARQLQLVGGGAAGGRRLLLPPPLAVLPAHLAPASIV